MPRRSPILKDESPKQNVMDQLNQDQLKSFIQQNDLFAGGLILMVLGFFFQSASLVWGEIRTRVTARFFVSVDIKNTDDCYDWTMNWLAKHHVSTEARLLSVKTDHKTGSQEDSRPVLTYLPAPGTHFVNYKGKWLLFQRIVEEGKSSGTIWDMRDKENLTISTYGSPQIIKDLLQEALELQYSDESAKTSIFMPDSYGDWEKVVSKPKRPLESVILNDGVSEMIVNDIKDFLASKAWYERRGLNHRRGYLLHGPPGCGKSSFLFALAGALDLNVCALSLSDPAQTDQLLAALLRKTPKRAAILLEDVDSAFVERSKGEDSNAKITFSGLLNALDGVATANEGQLIFMTTNHKERLAPALIRPGRVDMQIVFGLARRNQVERMFENFYPGSSSQKFASLVPDGTVSMAKLQDDPEKCVENVTQLFQEEKNPDDLKSADKEKEETEEEAARQERIDSNPLRASLELSRILHDDEIRSSKIDIRKSVDIHKSGDIRKSGLRHRDGREVVE